MSGAVQNPSTIESTNPAPGLDLIEPRELAAALGMSLRTLQRHHDNRTGPPRITLNRHVYYRRSSVAAWLQSCESYGAAPMRRLRKHVSPVGRLRSNGRARRAA